MLKTLFKNKKSTIEVSLIHLIELILAIWIVILLIYLALKLSGFFIGRQEYDSAVNNMEALTIRTKELVKDRKDVLTQTMVYSIPDNYILVGFNYNDNGIKTDCTGETIVSSRPKICSSKSCLCIYQNFGDITDPYGNDFDTRGGATPLRCKTFEEKIIFLTPQADLNFKGAQSQIKPNYNKWPNYNYLVLYGKCGNPLRPSWGVKQIYIDKYKEGNNIFIFIGEVKTKSDFKPADGSQGGAATGSI